MPLTLYACTVRIVSSSVWIEKIEDLSANGEKTNKTIETWGRKWRGINQGQWGTLIIYRFLIPLNTNWIDTQKKLFASFLPLSLSLSLSLSMYIYIGRTGRSWMKQQLRLLIPSRDHCCRRQEQMIGHFHFRYYTVNYIRRVETLATYLPMASHRLKSDWMRCYTWKEGEKTRLLNNLRK